MSLLARRTGGPRAPARRGARVAVAALAAAWLGLGLAAGARADATIYFHDPDVSIQDAEAFDKRVNKGLAGAGVALRAFEAVADLERTLRREAPDFVMVPPYVARALAGVKLRPVLIRQRKRDVSYEVIIVGQGALEDLAGGTLAAAGNAAQAAFLGSTLLAGTGLELGAVRVLEVGKDLDALLAAGRGQAAGACATRRSLELVKRANPGVGQRLKVLHAVEGIPEAVVYAFGDPDAAKVRAVSEALTRLHKKKSGRAALKMLRADRLVEVEGDVLKKVER